MTTNIWLKPAGGAKKDAQGNYPYDTVSGEGPGSVEGLYGGVPHQMIAGSLRFLQVTIPYNPVANWSGLADLTAGTAGVKLYPGITYKVVTPANAGPTGGTLATRKLINVKDSSGDATTDLADLNVADATFQVSETIDFDATAGTFGVGTTAKMVVSIEDGGIVNDANVLEAIVKAIQMRSTISVVGNANAGLTSGDNGFEHPAIGKLSADETLNGSGVGPYKVRLVLENNGHRVTDYRYDLQAVFTGQEDVLYQQQDTPGVVKVNAGLFLDDLKVEEINF